jgi:multidrug efflux system outer membrane protein
MNKLQQAVTWSAIGLLTGCSLAPIYVRPAAPIAATFSGEARDEVKGEANSAPRTATETGWREFFPDQRLQKLIAIALQNNRDLRTAALRIEEARALYNVQSADLPPTGYEPAIQVRWSYLAARQPAACIKSASAWHPSNWTFSDGSVA